MAATRAALKDARAEFSVAEGDSRVRLGQAIERYVIILAIFEERSGLEFD